MDAVGYALAQAITAEAYTLEAYTVTAGASGAYTIRGESAFGIIGGNLYIWFSNTVQKYDPVGDVWTLLKNNNTTQPNQGSGAFGVMGGRLYVAHATTATTYNTDLGYYDPVANDTFRLTTAPVTRDQYVIGAATELGLHVIGGRTSSTVSISTHYTVDSNHVWTARAALPMLGWAGKAAGRTGQLVVLEPINTGGDSTQTRRYFLYDTTANTWTEPADSGSVLPTITGGVSAARAALFTDDNQLLWCLLYTTTSNVPPSGAIWQRTPTGTWFTDASPPWLMTGPAAFPTRPADMAVMAGGPGIVIVQQNNQATSTSSAHPYPTHKFTHKKPITTARNRLLAYLAAK